MPNKKIILKRGIKVQDKWLNTLEIREPDLEDMISVEDGGISTRNYLKFNRALYAACIVKVDGYSGEVTPSMLNTLSQSDWGTLFDAFQTFETEGKSA